MGPPDSAAELIAVAKPFWDAEIDRLVTDNPL